MWTTKLLKYKSSNVSSEDFPNYKTTTVSIHPYFEKKKKKSIAENFQKSFSLTRSRY